MRRWKLSVLVVGIVALVVGMLWTPFARQRWVKFPGHLDVTSHLEGTYTLFVDPQTGAPAATPVRLPLVIDARLQSEPGGGASTVVLRETSTTSIAGRAQTQQNQYVIDRHTMRNLKSPLSWSGSPAQVVDRSGSYSVTFPFGASGHYRMWDDQTGATYDIGATGSTKVDGLSSVVFTGTEAPTVYHAVGFPATLTPAAFRAQLQGAGVDLAAVARQLAAILTPAEMRQVSAALAAPVPLVYRWSVASESDVHGRTGATLAIPSRVERLTVQPDLSGLTALAPVFLAHASDPTIGSLLSRLAGAGAAPPQPVFEIAYHSTPASTASIVHYLHSKLWQLDLVETWIPWSLRVVGVLMIAVAVVLLRRRAPGAPVGEPPLPAPPEREPELAAL